LRTCVLLTFLALSACSWFHPRAKPPPPAPELVVTGAPAGSAVFVDDVQSGQVAEVNGKPQVLAVSAGPHIVEVRTGDTVIYREQTYVGSGETRVVKVLSGLNRE
jgi:hypothetical protein